MRLSVLALVSAACLGAIVAACSSSSSNTPSPTPESGIAVRYQADDGRQALLQISPFQVGRNSFRVTVLDSQSQPAAVNSIDLVLSRLENDTQPTTVPATSSDGGKSFVAESELQQTGWWDIDVLLDGSAPVNFYLRLDSPSQAPLTFAPADYASDPAGEALFQKTLQGYQALSSVKEREQLTSGLLQPTGTGAAVVTDGEIQAPDRVHFVTASAGSGTNEQYRVGTRVCSRGVQPISAWGCQEAPAQKAFDLSYLHASTAFKLGRQEMVDGESSQVLLFYNPSQRAWFGWWIGQETGYLRRHVMVAPGHLMLTHYVGQDTPLSIELPSSETGAE